MHCWTWYITHVRSYCLLMFYFFTLWNQCYCQSLLLYAEKEKDCVHVSSSAFIPEEERLHTVWKLAHQVEVPCRRNAFCTSPEDLAAISLHFISAHTHLLWLTPHLALYTHTHQISFVLSLSQPPTLSQEGPMRGFTRVCAIFWCNISSCVRPHTKRSKHIKLCCRIPLFSSQRRVGNPLV